MARYKHIIRVQFRNKPAAEHKTNDDAQAKRIVDREIDNAKSIVSGITAVFWNDSLRWRRR